MRSTNIDGTVAVLAAVFFVELDLPSGMLRANSSPYTYQWGAATWHGVGHLGEMDGLTERAGVQAQQVNLALAGLPADQLADIVEEATRGRRGAVYIGLIDQAHALMADPDKIYAGLIDNFEVGVGPTVTVTCNLNNRFVGWQEVRDKRYTGAAQKQDFPGDRGLDFLIDLSTRRIPWGGG